MVNAAPLLTLTVGVLYQSCQLGYLLDSSLRLAIQLCLNGLVNEALFVIAVVCSSWSAVNLGTSKRDELVPYGDVTVAGVRCGNRMVGRTEWAGCFFFESVVFSKGLNTNQRLLRWYLNSMLSCFKYSPLMKNQLSVFSLQFFLWGFGIFMGNSKIETWEDSPAHLTPKCFEYFLGH